MSKMPGVTGLENPQEFNRECVIFLLYGPGKYNLHKCIILSETENIEKVLFKFLFWGNLLTYLFYLNFLRPSSLSEVI